MGVNLFNRCSGRQTEAGRYISVNPNPRKFEILQLFEDKNTYAEIRYPNCTTFEGIKVMVFRGCVAERLRRAVEIDPHFAESGLAPIARFEPTDSGRKLAYELTIEEIQ